MGPLRINPQADHVTLYRGTYRIETARLDGWDYRQPAWYFVTICTRYSAHYFGEVRDGGMLLSPVGYLAQNELIKVPEHYETVRLDTHAIMPNHIHAIIVIEGIHTYSPDAAIGCFHSEMNAPAPANHPSLANIVGGYKSAVTRACRVAGVTHFDWQTRFYDHVLRSNQTVAAAREYIQNNPKSWDKDPDHTDP